MKKEQQNQNDEINLINGKLKKRKNGFAITDIVLGAISIFLYAGILFILYYLLNFDYVSNPKSLDESIAALFFSMFHVVFAVGGVVVAAVIVAAMQIIQLVMYILGFTIKNIPRKPMIPATIFFFLSTAAGVMVVIVTYALISKLGI